MLTAKLKNRDLYLNRMIAFQDTGMIKVMTRLRAGWIGNPASTPRLICLVFNLFY